jgi:hypothetical protein
MRRVVVFVAKLSATNTAFLGAALVLSEFVTRLVAHIPRFAHQKLDIYKSQFIPLINSVISLLRRKDIDDI